MINWYLIVPSNHYSMKTVTNVCDIFIVIFDMISILILFTVIEKYNCESKYYLDWMHFPNLPRLLSKLAQYLGVSIHWSLYTLLYE